MKSPSWSWRLALLAPLLLWALCLGWSRVWFPRAHGHARVQVHGQAEPRFAAVKATFRQNFLEGRERDGAALAVFHRGRPVLDLFAGWADTARALPWRRDTRALLFSVTKPLAALCLALLVDRGHLAWDDLVSKHWPEYGVRGKQNTSVAHVLAHQAGLPYLEDEVSYEDALDAELMLRRLAEAEPLWEPGSASGYHALTFGWLLEGIVRGADPLHRDLASFFEQELARPLGLDLSIGLRSEADFGRTARLSQPGLLELLREVVDEPRLLIVLAAYYAQGAESVVGRAESNPKWLSFGDLAFNQPEVQRLPLAAVNGLASAGQLAQLFAAFLNGSLVSAPLVRAMSRPTLEHWHWERTVFYPLMKGYGFFYDYHPSRPGRYVFGHPGYGCQALHVDPEHELVLVYLSNGLKASTSLLCRPYQRLLQQVYAAL